MKTIVIYESKTGFTKKYAEWISKSLSCEAIPTKSVKGLDLSQYDALVFGGWFLAGSIKGFKQLRSQIAEFKGKKAVFVTGVTAPNSPEAVKLLNGCFTDDERKNTGIFYLVGGLNYSRMGFVYKSMMKMMSSMLKKQKGVDSVEYKTVSTSFDATNKKDLGSLLKYMKK